MFGIISCADSLTAIKTLVYDEKKLTLPELIAVLDHDFEGHDDIRRMCLSAPKYGNDDDTADDIATRLFHRYCRPYHGGGQSCGGLTTTILSASANSMSAEWGQLLCGICLRQKGGSPWQTPTALPSAQISAALRRCSTPCRSLTIQSTWVLSTMCALQKKELFKDSMDKVEAVLKAFYDNDGVQTNSVRHRQ